MRPPARSSLALRELRSPRGWRTRASSDAVAWRAIDRALAPRGALKLTESSAAPRAPSPRTSSLLVTPRLAHATIRAALRAGSRARTESRYGSLASRARASAALPVLRLRATRTTDESLRLTPTSSDPYRYTQAGGASLALEAQATWNLDRAVFADEELQVEHLRRLRAQQDARLVEDVLRALFAWQRAVVDAAAPDAPPRRARVGRAAGDRGRSPPRRHDRGLVLAAGAGAAKKRPFPEAPLGVDLRLPWLSWLQKFAPFSRTSKGVSMR